MGDAPESRADPTDNALENRGLEADFFHTDQIYPCLEQKAPLRQAHTHRKLQHNALSDQPCLAFHSNALGVAGSLGSQRPAAKITETVAIWYISV